MPGRLDLSGSATFDAAGTATVYLPLVPFAERWTVTSLNINTTSAQRTSCDVYRNSVNPITRLDGVELSGNKNTTDTVMELEPNDRLVVQWNNGTPGAVATVTAAGVAVTRGG
jgi:hypothetical protein